MSRSFAVEFEKINIFFDCIYLNMRNEKYEETSPYAALSSNAYDKKNNGLEQNLFAASIAQSLFCGKNKNEIKRIVDLLYLVIALSKSYC